MRSSNPEALVESAHGLAARLVLRRPLVFIDLETTGLSTQEDRIARDDSSCAARLMAVLLALGRASVRCLLPHPVAHGRASVRCRR